VQISEPGVATLPTSEEAVQSRKLRNQRIGLIAGILITLGAIIAAFTWFGTGSAATDSTKYAGVAISEDDSSITVGPSNAPVKIVVYEDFGCAYCALLEQSTYDFLQQNAAKGKVQVDYRPISAIPDPAYPAAALNSWAAVLKHGTPAAALKLHNLLFANWTQVASGGKVAADVEQATIEKLVREAGGDNASVRAAMEAQDNTFLTVAAKAAAADGVSSAPTVLINGTKIEGQDVYQLVTTIEDRVAAGS
jgi:protein-disulfide isomerase